MQWKFCVVLLLFCFLFSPLYSESSEEFTVPDLIPTEEYVMKGQDIMTLYQTVKDLNETKKEYQSLTDEMMITLNDAMTLSEEYKSENQKLQIQNNFLIGTTVCSVGIVVAGVITLVVMNIN